MTNAKDKAAAYAKGTFTSFVTGEPQEYSADVYNMRFAYLAGYAQAITDERERILKALCPMRHYLIEGAWDTWKKIINEE